MSKRYEKAGKGALFFESDRDSDKRPLLKGSAEILERKFEVAAWPRTTDKGLNYLSLQVKLGNDVVGNGAMFERANSNRKAPNMNGPVEISGLKFDFAAWKAKSEAGMEYYRMKIDQIIEEA